MPTMVKTSSKRVRNAKANRVGRCKFYGDYFVKGLSRLNITPPAMLPRATEHIQEQIDLIKKLEEKDLRTSLTMASTTTLRSFQIC